MKSLTAQVSALTRLTAANPIWLLVDVYIDIASSKIGSSRKEFTRMLKDCQSHDLEIILTKTISRFGRDTVEILDALNKLKVLGVRVIFEQEQLDDGKHDFYYKAEENNPAIIPKETFQAVQIEKRDEVM